MAPLSTPEKQTGRQTALSCGLLSRHRRTITVHRAFAKLIAVASLFPLASVAAAQTTYTYEYDVYGQLVRTERGTGTSTRVRYAYDAAGNRTRVKQGASGPTAYNDLEFFEGGGGTIYALGNDQDPDLPYDTLTITGVSGGDSSYASVIGGGAAISFSAPDGSYSFNYAIQDADGLTSSASISVTIFTINCGPYEC